MIQSQNHATSHLWPRGSAHTSHKHTDIPHKRVFKKPGMCRPVAGARLVQRLQSMYVYARDSQNNLFGFK